MQLVAAILDGTDIENNERMTKKKKIVTPKKWCSGAMTRGLLSIRKSETLHDRGHYDQPLHFFLTRC